MVVAVDSAVVALPIILLARFFGVRSWIAYVAAGVIAAVLSTGMLWLLRGGDAFFPPLVMAWLAGAGAAGGLAYWAVAGRGAPPPDASE